MPRSGPLGTFTLPGAQKTQQPNTTIPSAVNNQGWADVEQTFNTITPEAYGGTGASTFGGAADNLSPAPVNVASAATTNIGAATSPNVILTGNATITAFDVKAVGVRRHVYVSGTPTLTYNATSLILPGGTNIAGAAGDTFEAVSLGSGNWRIDSYSRANGQAVITTSTPPKGGIFGLTTSNNVTDADHDIDIAAGQAASDSATPVTINLNSATTKRFDATFAEGSGNGGFATGESLPTSGTIHLWLIAKADGTADVFANNNATSGLAPTLPTGFTQKRRIASLRTDASANIVGYTQVGDTFWLKSRALDVDNLGNASGVLAGLTVPVGLQLIVSLAASINGGSATRYALITNPGDNNDAAAQTNHDLVAATTVGQTNTNMQRYTNTSGQVRYRTDSTANVTFFRIWTLGWTDLTR